MKSAPAKQPQRSGWIMLGITAVLYLAAFLFSAEKGTAALNAGLGILEEILPVILVVFFLMALLNTYLNPKSIAQRFGAKAGVGGWLFALIGGVLSHGPAYAWYPLLAEMREHGMRSGLTVAFFYARAIKLPWLPVMISYFGAPFTLLLCIYILLGAWLQGIIAEQLLKKGGTPRAA